MLTDRLPDTSRQAVRFTVVGSTGTLLQYGLYWGLLTLFGYFWPENNLLTTVAYTAAFLLETITNYLLTSYYTFSQKPSWKNLGGFLTSRICTYLVQISLLQIFLLTPMSDEVAGAVTMVVAGIVNFFVVRFFFSKTK